MTVLMEVTEGENMSLGNDVRAFEGSRTRQGLGLKGLESSRCVKQVRNLKCEDTYDLILLCSGKDGGKVIRDSNFHVLWELTPLCCLNGYSASVCCRFLDCTK